MTTILFKLPFTFVNLQKLSAFTQRYYIICIILYQVYHDIIDFNNIQKAYILYIQYFLFTSI